MGASMRGVTTGLAGSAAVLAVAALSLAAAAHARVMEDRPQKPAGPVVRVQPAAAQPAESRPALPLWLKRLLKRSDLETQRSRS